MNLGLWRSWRRVPEIQLLAQTYDSITFQFDASRDMDDIVGRVLELIRVELVSPSGRRYVVPGEAKIGWNWGSRVTAEDQAKARAEGKRVPRLNLGGLVKYKPGMWPGHRPQTGLGRVMV